MRWQEQHGAQVREDYLRLLRQGGPGWHAYVLDRAETLAKGDPEIHGGLVNAVEAEIGPKATQEARRALKWFRGEKATA